MAACSASSVQFAVALAGKKSFRKDFRGTRITVRSRFAEARRIKSKAARRNLVVRASDVDDELAAVSAAVEALRLENERLKNSLDPSSVVDQAGTSEQTPAINPSPPTTSANPAPAATPPLRHPPPLRGLLPHPRLHHLLRPLPQLSRKPHLLLLHQRPQQAAILLLLLGHL